MNTPTKERETTMRKCEMEWRGYPHPGCAEFGPPDEFHCDADAVRVFVHSDIFGTHATFACADHEEDACEGLVPDPFESWSLEGMTESDISKLLNEKVTVEPPDDVYFVLDSMAHAFGSIDTGHCYACYLARPEDES